MYHFKNTQMNKFTKLLLFLLVPGMTMLLLPSCEDYSEKLTGSNPSGNAVDVSSRITGTNPELAGGGADLTILGTSLGGVTMVNMGGLWIGDVTASESEVTFKVPANVEIGDVDLVLVFAGSERAHTEVEVIPLPNVTFFTPIASVEGDEIIVDGANFQFATSLSVGDVEATITSKDDNQIIFTVPSGATSGTLNITAVSGSVTSSENDLAVCSTDPGHNLCMDVPNTNGSFEESDLGEASGINGWGGLHGSRATGEIVDTDFIDGSQSVKMTVVEIGANPWNIQPTSAFPVDHNTTYVLRVWVKGTGLPRVKIAVDQGGTPGWSDYVTIDVNLTNSEWQEVTYTFSPAAEDPGAGGDGSARFAVSMSYPENLGGVFYMDNLRITKL